MLTFGSGPKPLWVIARQHPGESMCGWFMDGLVDRLCDPYDPVARALMAQGDPAGRAEHEPRTACSAAHLRTNAKGANLNREWREPSLENSPEVFHTIRRMEATGVAMCLDVHGDEALPYNFIAGYEGIPGPERGAPGATDPLQGRAGPADPRPSRPSTATRSRHRARGT